MISMRSLVLILGCVGLLLAVITHTATSQQRRATYAEFVALLEHGERLEENCLLSAKELSGTTLEGRPITVPLVTVKNLYVSVGPKSGRYALLGGAYGLGIGLAATLLVEGQGDGKLNYGNIGVLVAAGAVIGAVLGAGQQSWEAVDLDAYRRSSQSDPPDSFPIY